MTLFSFQTRSAVLLLPIIYIIIFDMRTPSFIFYFSDIIFLIRQNGAFFTNTVLSLFFPII